MAVFAVIPARYDASRFPGKPLAADTGKPLIQHVVEQTRKAQCIDRALVATDDQRIFDAVLAFGGEAIMTGRHPNGTSRIAEAIELLPQDQQPDIVVNVQGDEPEIEPELIDAAVAALKADPDAGMSTLASPFADDEDPADPNIVKLVVSQRNRALYFSRSLIPFDRDASPNATAKHAYLKHPGLYAYRRAFLSQYIVMPATPLEKLEKLEQLRVLEHDRIIAVARVETRHHGIDTPEQYAAFVERHRRTLG